MMPDSGLRTLPTTDVAVVDTMFLGFGRGKLFYKWPRKQYRRLAAAVAAVVVVVIELW